MSSPGPRLLHATCVALSGHGVLLRGPSGSGKSDLALRLIDRGAVLVADDQVALTVENGQLTARAPASLRGMIEVRGIGIVHCPSADSAPVRLVADLVPPDRIVRMPAPEQELIVDMPVSRIAVTPFEAAAAIKVALALDIAVGAAGVMR